MIMAAQEETSRIKELGDILNSTKPIVLNICQITSYKYPWIVGEKVIGCESTYSFQERMCALRELKTLKRSSSNKEVRKSIRYELRKPRKSLATQCAGEFLNKHPFLEVGVMGACFTAGVYASIIGLGYLIHYINKLGD